MVYIISVGYKFQYAENIIVFCDFKGCHFDGDCIV